MQWNLTVACAVLLLTSACVDEPGADIGLVLDDSSERAGEAAEVTDPVAVAAATRAASPVPAPATCEGSACCPRNYAARPGGSQERDSLVNADHGACLALHDGDDELTDAGAHTYVRAGAGNDVIRVDGSDHVDGGPGDDTIDAASGVTEIDGGPGADAITTHDGHHIITPGPGADTVLGGRGDIVVQVFDACELERGERLVGNGRDDTLVLPVSLAEAERLGASIAGFEHINVTGATCRSACAPVGCVPGLGALAGEG